MEWGCNNPLFLFGIFGRLSGFESKVHQLLTLFLVRRNKSSVDEYDNLTKGVFHYRLSKSIRVRVRVYARFRIGIRLKVTIMVMLRMRVRPEDKGWG